MTLMAATLDAPKRRRRARRSVWSYLGIGMVIAGLAVLGYIAWQFFGTNIVAKQNQKAEIAQLEQAWADNIDGDAIGLLRITDFGYEYEVPILRGFSNEVLRSGVGWYEKGALPGEIGNFVIAGHRTTNGQPFLSLPDLRPGDLVEVETRTHLYTYKLRTGGDEIRVTYDTSWPLQAVPEEGMAGAVPTERLLTLLTCSELFSSPWRTVVIAELDDVIEKPSPEKTKPSPEKTK